MANVSAALLTWTLHMGIVAVLCGPLIWWSSRRRALQVTAADQTSAEAEQPLPAESAQGGRARAAPTSRAGVKPRVLAAAAAIYAVVLIVAMLEPAGPFTALERNWQAGLLLLAFSLFLVLGWRQLSPAKVGLTRPREGAWQIVIFATIGALVIQFAVGAMGPWRAPTVESFLHAATMPGLWEELMFRGLLLHLILVALPGRRQVLGLSVTWAMVITSLLFGMVHGVLIDPVRGLQIDLGYVLFSAVSGVLFVWLRERSGSILPVMVLHNTINLSGLLVLLLRS